MIKFLTKDLHFRRAGEEIDGSSAHLMGLSFPSETIAQAEVRNRIDEFGQSAAIKTGRPTLALFWIQKSKHVWADFYGVDGDSLCDHISSLLRLDSMRLRAMGGEISLGVPFGNLATPPCFFAGELRQLHVPQGNVAGPGFGPTFANRLRHLITA